MQVCRLIVRLRSTAAIGNLPKRSWSSNQPSTQPGTEIRLRGRGVPHLRRSSQRGDLHVIINVTVPTKLSKKQRELLEAFAKESGETVFPGGGLREKLGL